MYLSRYLDVRYQPTHDPVGRRPAQPEVAIMPSLRPKKSSESIIILVKAKVKIDSLFKLNDNQIVHCQFAMLYSDTEGVRKIRIFNYHWKVAKNLLSYF